MNSNTTNLIYCIIFAVIIASCVLQYENFTNEVTLVKSSIDGNHYLVRNVPDKQEAANLLSRLKNKCMELTHHMKNNHGHKSCVKRLIKNYNPDNISEGAKNNKYTSYSVNKGEKIVFCLRSRDKEEKLADLNILLFVAIHELSHVMSKSIGHTEEFWTNFKFLLEEAIAIGVYKHHDFRRNPVKYCGTDITDSPV